jgi:acyl-CoA synthetase (NDP forming)
VAHDVTDELIRATADRPDLMPVYISLTSGEPPPETKRHLDDAGGVPILRGTVEAFTGIASLAAWEAARSRRLGDGPTRASWPALAADRTPWGYDTQAQSGAADAGTTSLPERESLLLLAGAGIPVVEARPAVDADAAVAAAAELGGNVALKLDAEGLAHKSDVGAVRLALAGSDAVRAAADELLALGVSLTKAGKAAVRGVLVEPMAPPGLELIAGITRDPQFGPIVLVGIGGVLAEVLDDVSLRLAPVSATETLAMLEELRGARLLDLTRGRPAIDRDAVASILVALGALAVARPDIRAIDLNPLIARADGAVAVDALVVLEPR